MEDDARVYEQGALKVRHEGRPTAVSLFSGAGGLDIGLEQAGWHTTFASDIDKDSVATLRANKAAGIPVQGQRRRHLSRTKIMQADVRDLSQQVIRPRTANDDWRPTLLAGGPPCQPWSSAGSQKGLSDPRGGLILEMLRLTKELRPSFVLMENVQGLVTARGHKGVPGEVLQSIEADLKVLGYATRVALLNAADFGAPQRRVRLFVMASLGYRLPDFPQPTHSKSDPNLNTWKDLGSALQEVPPPADEDVVRPSGERATALRELTPGTGLKTQGRVMANRPSGQWGYRQDSFVASLELPARTIRAAATPDWIRLPNDSDLRRLTVDECAHLQGFPLDWRISGRVGSRFRQVGNAVQVDVARSVGEQIFAAWAEGPAEMTPGPRPWPQNFTRRLRYTTAEHRVNGHLRQRGKNQREAEIA